MPGCKLIGPRLVLKTLKVFIHILCSMVHKHVHVDSVFALTCLAVLSLVDQAGGPETSTLLA